MELRLRKRTPEENFKIVEHNLNSYKAIYLKGENTLNMWRSAFRYAYEQGMNEGKKLKSEELKKFTKDKLEEARKIQFEDPVKQLTYAWEMKGYQKLVADIHWLA